MAEEFKLLTEKQMVQIDELFEKYWGKDEKKLFEELKHFAYPDGSWSLYIRWRLDVLATGEDGPWKII